MNVAMSKVLMLEIGSDTLIIVKLTDGTEYVKGFKYFDSVVSKD